jgi:asparagine synthase (glutamine-hydrolysing)
LPEDSLARSDRMGAHAGADIRYPLLDRAFLQLLAGLPSVMKVHPRGLGFVTKWPLRELLGRRLPEQLVNRPKRSLPNPLSQWLRGGGAEFLREQIEAVCEEDAELFVPGTVRRLMTEHLSGAQDHGLKLWTLLLFRTWRQSSGA